MVLEKKFLSKVMERIGVFSVEEVLPYVPSEVSFVKNGISPKKKYAGEMVSMGVLKMRLFAQKGVVCARCGIEGKWFILERHPKNSNKEKYHFNLYAEKDGHLTLMTKDHIFPRCFGGTTDFDNLQVMCADCNVKKSNIVPSRFAEKLENFKNLKKTEQSEQLALK